MAEVSSLLKRLCRVVLFLSQLYVFSGRGSLSFEHFQAAAQAIKDQPHSSSVPPSTTKITEVTPTPDYISKCPSNDLCTKLPTDCMQCSANHSCIYGKPATFECIAKPHVMCVDDNHQKQENFTITMTCQYCWQLPPSDYECSKSNSSICKTVACPRQRYNATCTVKDHVHCLGRRVFPKMLYCNWTGGYKWSTALALSITLGGFGADRFYLGQWREGLGKLFSFGGLGIWTLIDVFLICVGYVGPADGSLYI
ncbi:TM2 domain-containing protein 3 [Pyxicephalus adspersus]|uniref:TM2 domain-containing protein 3 n=1 Tax=Pyxicephalus adspersus TaxID=30357 RepID=A0AAV3B3A2_PYXAD|nr:TPA: hypothetical protein GDO54_007492 [Pyxicephalus adspersus]